MWHFIYFIWTKACRTNVIYNIDSFRSDTANFSDQRWWYWYNDVFTQGNYCLGEKPLVHMISLILVYRYTILYDKHLLVCIIGFEAYNVISLNCIRVWQHMVFITGICLICRIWWDQQCPCREALQHSSPRDSCPRFCHLIFKCGWS